MSLQFAKESKEPFDLRSLFVPLWMLLGFRLLLCLTPDTPGSGSHLRSDWPALFFHELVASSLCIYSYYSFWLYKL